LVGGWVRVLLFLLLVQIRPTTRSALAQSHLDEEFKSGQGEAKTRRQDGGGGVGGGGVLRRVKGFGERVF
jgi:hypothetical protein